MVSDRAVIGLVSGLASFPSSFKGLLSGYSSSSVVMGLSALVPPGVSNCGSKFLVLRDFKVACPPLSKAMSDPRPSPCGLRAVHYIPRELVGTGAPQCLPQAY